MRNDAWGTVPAVVRNKFTFAFSYKVGGVAPQTLYDPRVHTLWLFSYEGNELRVHRQTRLKTELKAQIKEWGRYAVAFEGPIFAFAPFRFGATLHVIFDTGTEIRVLSSIDEGRSWAISTLKMENTRLLGATLSADGSTLVLLGIAAATVISNDPRLTEEERNLNQGDLVRATLKFDGTKWTASPTSRVRKRHPSGTLPQKENIVSLLRGGGVHYVVSQEADKIRIDLSTDEITTLAEIVTGDG